MKTRHGNQQIVDDVRRALQTAQDLLDLTAGGSGLDKAREKLATSTSQLRDQWSQLPDRAGDAVNASRRVAREHPYQTAGGGLFLLAAIAGLLWYWQRQQG